MPGTLARESFIGGSYDLSQTNQSHAGRTHLHSRPYGTSDPKNVAKKKVYPHYRRRMERVRAEKKPPTRATLCICAVLRPEPNVTRVVASGTRRRKGDEK